MGLEADEDDNHVLFLAVEVVGSKFLATDNVKDFPQEHINGLYPPNSAKSDIPQSVTLDELFCLMYDANPDLTVTVVIETLSPLIKNEPSECMDMLATKCSCPKFLNKLERHRTEILFAIHSRRDAGKRAGQ